VFFGHYALEAPLLIHGNAVCVDAGIAKGGSLAAYRFNSNAQLNSDGFVYSSN
jgi:hypothetical protein